MLGLASVSFNSRTREGCDYQAVVREQQLMTFQFTHPRGVRHPFPSAVLPGRTFQFTHPRGVRRSDRWRASYSGEVSIHAPARGATGAGS